MLNTLQLSWSVLPEFLFLIFWLLIPFNKIYILFSKLKFIENISCADAMHLHTEYKCSVYFAIVLTQLLQIKGMKLVHVRPKLCEYSLQVFLHYKTSYITVSNGCKIAIFTHCINHFVFRKIFQVVPTRPICRREMY